MGRGDCGQLLGSADSDPPSKSLGAAGVLHAKAVVVNVESIVVTSANLTTSRCLYAHGVSQSNLSGTA